MTVSWQGKQLLKSNKLIPYKAKYLIVYREFIGKSDLAETPGRFVQTRFEGCSATFGLQEESGLGKF